MRKFNPVEYMRERWGDRTHTKNHPRQCEKDHKYCHVQYEWGQDNQTHAGSVAVVGREETEAMMRLPPNAENGLILNYQMMTEECLDDWFAQSVNRSLASLVNPQNNLELPTSFVDDLRTRHGTKTKHFEEEAYFKVEKPAPRRKTLSYMGPKEEKKRNPAMNRFFDFRQLQPKMIAGTPIRSRESQDVVKPAVRRRNAVLLLNDIHYGRLLKKMAKSKDQTEEPVPEERFYPKNKKNMLYSFNMESMQRTTCEEDVPNSIIERQFQRIRQPQKDFMTANRNTLKKQEEIQEKIRQSINDKTVQALTQIDIIAARQKTPQDQRKNSIARRTSTVGTRGKLVPSNILLGPQIEQKVLKLLNSMQVVSQHIDVEMANLNIHLPEITVRHSSDTIQHKWIIKAEEKIKQKQNLLAIDCYKQALILQPDSFIPIYNIAVLLQKQKMLTYAKEWFLLAKEKDTDTEKVSFGLALVLVKQLNFPVALREIDELIQKLEKGDHKKKIDMTYYYLRALCNKKLEQFQKARSDYEIIIKHSKPSNYNSLSYFLLSVVFARSRRYKQKFNCLSYMNWRETLHLLFYEKGKKVKEDGMGNSEFVDKLSKQVFFNRFSKNLLKKFIEKGNYEVFKKDTIIFASEEESLIVVNGLVSIWSHQNSITCPDTVSVLGQGGVIGAGEIDNNLSSRPNYWFLAKTDLEVVRISREEFRLFWQGQITFEWDFKYNFLKNVGLFKGLPDSTLFKLCQFVELKEYSKGEILFNDCSYRNQLISKEGLGFCLGKTVVDPRFVNVKKLGKGEEMLGRRRIRSRLWMLIKKHTFKFNEMKFNRLKFRGLFVMVEGKIEIEDDRGFRCKDIMSPRDYFGENLMIHSQGFHNYGRMLVDSPSAKFYLLNTDKMLWTFTSLDKQTMTENARNRKEIETVRFLRNRFSECLEIKMQKLLAKRD